MNSQCSPQKSSIVTLRNPPHLPVRILVLLHRPAGLPVCAPLPSPFPSPSPSPSLPLPSPSRPPPPPPPKKKKKTGSLNSMGPLGS